MHVTLARHILGVHGGAPSPDEIRDAWRRYARTHHPDRCPGDPQAALRFSAGRDAYEVLRSHPAAPAADHGPPRPVRPGCVVRGPHEGAAPYAFPDLARREWRA